LNNSNKPIDVQIPENNNKQQQNLQNFSPPKGNFPQQGNMQYPQQGMQPQQNWNNNMSPVNQNNQQQQYQYQNQNQNQNPYQNQYQSPQQQGMQQVNQNG
jgi:hypothetical protein